MQFIETKNKANKANMERVMKGATDQLLTRLLRGLSGAKVTKSGSFRAADGHSPFLGCSYRNDAGTRRAVKRQASNATAMRIWTCCLPVLDAAAAASRKLELPPARHAAACICLRVQQ